jgi:hypothetical protein
MGLWFTMEVGLLQHGGFHFSMGPELSILLQHYGPHLSTVYGCTSSVEDNAFIRGMECKVAREVVGGPRGTIVIIVEAIQCKVD